MKTPPKAFVALLFALPAVAYAQSGFIPVTGTHIYSKGQPATGATFCARPVSAAGVPIAVKIGGVGGQVTDEQYCVAVNNGAFAINLPDTSVTSPINACFAATVKDSTGVYILRGGYGCMQPTSAAGSPWCTPTGCNFDLFPPNLPALALVQTGPVGPASTVPGPPGITIACGTVGCTTPGPFVGQTVDGLRFAGQSYSGGTTIAAAIADAAAASAGSVVIPDGYAGTDSALGSNPTNVPIMDLRKSKNATLVINALAQFPLMDDEAFGNFDTLSTCLTITKACNIAGIGDSVMQGNYGNAAESSYFWRIVQALQQHYPGVTFTASNFGIAGTTLSQMVDPSFACSSDGTFFSSPANTGTHYVIAPHYPGTYVWEHGCTPGVSWIAHMQASAPDLVIERGGGNDGGQPISSVIGNLNTFKANLQSWAKSPSLVVTTLTTPSSYNFNQAAIIPSILAISAAERGWAKANQFAVADWGRLYWLHLTGQDVVDTYFNLNQNLVGFPASYALTGSGSATNWTGAGSAYGSGSATASGGVLTIPAGGAGILYSVPSLDGIIDATFSPSVSTGTISLPYRTQSYSAGSQPERYQLQATYSSTSGSYSLSGQLFYIAPTGASGVSIPGTAFSCVVGSGLTVSLRVRFIGLNHELWCNGAKMYTVVDGYMSQAGTMGVGIQNAAGTITGVNFWPGVPSVNSIPLAHEAALLGDAFTGDLGNGDYLTNPFSKGGNAINHPSFVSAIDLGVASFHPVMQAIDTYLARIGQYSAQWFRARGAISSNSPGSVTMDYSAGAGRIISVGASGPTPGTVHFYMVSADGSVNLDLGMIGVNGLSMGGGAGILNTSQLPRSTSPLSVGHGLCSKGGGLPSTDPVSVGYCSTALDSTGTCTCN